jgi:mandelamide amidase
VPFQRDLSPDVQKAFDETLAALSARGVTLVDGEIPDLEPLIERMSVITIGGAVRRDLEAYLRDSGALATVDEVFAAVWHPQVRGWLGEYFRPSPAASAAYEGAWRDTFVQLRARVADYFMRQRVAAIVAPAVPITAAIEVAHTGDLVIDGRRVPDGVWRNIQNTLPASAWDGPGIALPAGVDRDGLPIGIELDGPLRADRELLAVALAVERALPRIPAPPGRA